MHDDGRHHTDPDEELVANLFGGITRSEDTVEFVQTHDALLTTLFGAKPHPLRVDRYELLSRIGGGGQADVYRAFDSKLNRLVALKLPRVTEASAVLGALAEAQAMAAVVHPNVVQVFDVGADDRWVYISMELLPGVSLREWLDEPRDTAAILRAFRYATLGLAAAHTAGVVHGDFKPDNVLVTADRVAVTDFGLARLLAPGTTAAGDSSDATSVRGTPRYMAPEVRTGSQPTAESDHYSLCLSVREALGDRLQALPHLRVRLEQGLDDDPSLRPANLDALVAALRPPAWRDKARHRVSVAVSIAVVAVSAVLIQPLIPSRPPPPPIFALDFSSTCSSPNCPQLVSGVVGSAAFFDGEASYLKLSDTAAFHATELTVAAWVRVDTLSVDHQSIVAKPFGPDTDDSIELMLYDNNGDGRVQPSFGISDGEVGRMATARDGAITEGQWSFLAGTWDGAEVTIWVDGVAHASEPAQRIDFDDHAFIVSGDRDGGRAIDDLFHGTIDELMLFDRALSQQQLENLQISKDGSPGQTAVDTDSARWLR